MTMAITVNEADRTGRALKAYLLIQNGMSRAEACQTAGLSVRQYQRAMNETDVRRMMAQEVQGALASSVGPIVKAIPDIVERLIGDALAEGTAPKERLSILKELSGLAKELSGVRAAFVLPTEEEKKAQSPADDWEPGLDS